MTYVIAEPCVDVINGACVDECPVDCIYEGVRMLYINPLECVECAACETVCPVDAVHHEKELPEKWSAYTDANASFFKGLGTPGGASILGPLNHDAELVANLPSKLI